MSKRYRKPARTQEKTLRVLVYSLLMSAFALVFIYSGSMLVWNMWVEPAQNTAVNNEIREIYTQAMGGKDEVPDNTPGTAGDSVDGTEDDAPRRTEAVRRLAEEVNGDIVGWLSIGGTVINYPVLQTSAAGGEYYLYRNYKGEYSRHGSVFLDAACSPAGDMQVLYGHSMNDGSMFRSLVNFGDPAVVAASPVIRYDTADEASEWLIVSVFKTNTLPSQGKVFNYIRDDFDSAEDKLNYIYQVMQRSIVNTHVGVNESDDLLVLSTCSYEFSEFRTVVVARRLRPGESLPAVQVELAENTLYPACWYRRYGGEAFPWPEDITLAKEWDLIDWHR